MKAELMQRLFRAIKEHDTRSIEKVCSRVVEDERRKGHAELADRLAAILRAGPTTDDSRAGASDLNAKGSTLQSLPLRLPELYTLFPRERLRHHMVLPEDVEARLRRVETEFTRRELLATYGLFPRRRILLYGPPGNGKTLSAERLAWNTGMPLVKVRFDALISSYLGETASNLRKVFEIFREHPVVLFLDECDSIARSREETNDVGEIPRIVNTLLTLLDEYSLPGLLVAATNLEGALDTAFFRRFDDIFQIPKPHQGEILKLMRMTLASFEISSDIEWGYLVGQLNGKSAAFVVKAIQDAAKLAIFADRRTVRQSDIESAIGDLHHGDLSIE